MTDDATDERDSTDSSPAGAHQCAHCGSILDLHTWTLTATDDDLSIYRFCDEECREAWRAE